MNTVLNYLAISALTTAAATAVAMGEPATLELAIARVGLMLGSGGEVDVSPFSVELAGSSQYGIEPRAPIRVSQSLPRYTKMR